MDSSASLMQFASTLALEAIKSGATYLQSMDISVNDEKGDRNISSHDCLVLLTEFAFLYLHITDRMAMGTLSAEHRNNVLSFVGEIVIGQIVDTYCEGWPRELRLNMKEECNRNYGKFVDEYGRYKKLMVGGDESPAGSLLWEFGKNIDSLCSCRDGILANMAVMELATSSLKTLEIRTFVNSLSE